MHKRSGDNLRLTAIDGIRALAIIVIMLSHTHVLENGGFGNAIFFAMTGFFAGLPFASQENGGFAEQKILSKNGIWRYYTGKLFRIYPPYILTLLFVRLALPGYVFQKSFKKVALFMEPELHLWFLQHIVVFYLIVPVILIPLFILNKYIQKKNLGELAGAVILLFASLWFFCHPVRVPFIHLQGAFRIDQMLLGMSGAYIYRFLKHNGFSGIQQTWWNGICAVCVLVYSAFVFLSSHEVIRHIDPAYDEVRFGWDHPLISTLLTIICLLLICWSDSRLVNGLLGNKIMSLIGRISYSMYLIHMFLIHGLDLGHGLRVFLFVVCMSMGYALLMEVLISRPAMIFGKTLRFRNVANYFRELKL